MNSTTRTFEVNMPARLAGASSDWPEMASGIVFFILAALVAATFQDYGISWDEMVQNTYGKKLLEYYASGFRDLSAFNYSNLYLYGGFFDLVAALINHVSPFGEYETRHLLGGLVFLTGLFGAWRLADLLAGSRAALIALVCLASTPVLYGHGFINPKDSPLAWLHVWVLYFGCRILARPEQPSFATLAGFSVSLGLALGTRVIAVEFLALLAGVLVIYISQQTAKAENVTTFARQTWRIVRPLALATLAALPIMVALWPWSAQGPQNIIQALEIFSRFGWRPLVLWGGELLPSGKLPADYLTQLLLFKLPEYALVGIVLALAFAVAAARRERWALLGQSHARQYGYVALSAIAPVVGFIVMRPVVYNGLRHFLFIVPPLVILSAIGLDKTLTFAAARRNSYAIIVGTFLTLGVGLQVARMVQLHPYEHVGYNALIGGIAGAETRYELDYWGTSLGEASRGLVTFARKNHLENPSVFVCGDQESAAYFLPKDFKITDQLWQADFYIGINDPPCRYRFDEPKRAIYEVRREGVPLSYVIDLRPPAIVPALSSRN